MRFDGKAAWQERVQLSSYFLSIGLQKDIKKAHLSNTPKGVFA